MSNFLTSNEIAAQFRVSPQTVYSWRRRGLITAHKLGGAVRFAEEDVLAFLASARGKFTSR